MLGVQAQAGGGEDGEHTVVSLTAASPDKASGPDEAEAGSPIPVIVPRPLHVCSGAGGLPHATAGKAGWSVDILAQACVTVAANHTEQEVFHMEIGKIVAACQKLDGARQSSGFFCHGTSCWAFLTPETLHICLAPHARCQHRTGFAVRRSAPAPRREGAQ